VALRSVQRSQEHVRTALHLLGEIEDHLRVPGLVTPERYHLFRLLAATRRQLWLAVPAGESRRGTLRWWGRPRRVGRERAWAAMILLEVVSWCTLAIGFVLSCLWRYVRSALHVLWRN
jgi:hypothetical protein